jgi:hypothetical protein
MKQISIKAIIIAFAAEIAADILIQSLMFAMLASGTVTSDMTAEEMRNASKVITSGGNYLFWQMLLGTATTIGGGYLAARIAKTFPYYNGLGIGLLGCVFSVIFWAEGQLWLNILGLLMNIPASIYGAHIAKKHMSAVQ